MGADGFATEFSACTDETARHNGVLLVPEDAPQVAYRVVDWAAHFENNRTKELKNMAWVPMPNKMDGDGYTQLLEHHNGAAHFGGWCACVEIASKCDPRGTLLRAGRIPHDPDSLSRISRIKSVVFSEVLPRLLIIGWLELVNLATNEVIAIPQEGAALPHLAASSRVRAHVRAEWKGTEGNRTIQKEDGGAPPKPPVSGRQKKTRDPLIAAINSVGGKIRGRKIPSPIKTEIVHAMCKARLVSRIGNLEIASHKAQNGHFIIIVGTDGIEHQIPSEQLTPQNIILAEAAQ